jgi:hypothetical protein
MLAGAMLARVIVVQTLDVAISDHDELNDCSLPQLRIHVGLA